MTGTYTVKFDGPALPEGQVGFFTPSRDYITDPQMGIFSGTGSLQADLKALEPGSFLLVSQQFSEVGRQETVGQFIEPGADENELGYTRERNTHGLQFGQLILSSVVDKEKTVLVAMKPFDFARDAAHEFGVHDFINSKAKPRRPVMGLLPLGFYRYEDGDYAFISEYEEEIISYDTLFWDPEQRPTNDQVRKALARCALAMGTGHLLLFTFGDAQVKNFSTDNTGIRFIDLEAAQGFPHSDSGLNLDLVRSRVGDDIDTFVNSLNHGIEDIDLHQDYTDVLDEVFAKKYSAIVQLPHSRVPEEVRFSREDIVKLVA